MIQLNATTYGIPGLGDRLTPPVITIGGKDAKKFAPNLNIGYDFGGGEEYFDNLNRTDKIITAKSEIKHDGDTVRLIEGSDIDEIYTDDRGRVKWDVVFEKCPESFVLEWRRTCSDGLTAYYQDVLTEEEIREGAYRPDDVIGSYAIYCDKAHNWIRPLNRKREIPADWKSQLSAGADLADVNIHSYREYKKGKVGHKYRPFVIDANGKTAWCSLLIIRNIERVTLPENFMQSAAYPVRLDPTFGYETQGASSTSFYNAYAPRCSVYGTHTASSGDKITQYSIYAHTVSGGSSVDIAAYSIVSGDPNTRIAAVQSVFIGTTPEWKNTSVVEQVLSNGVVYGIGFGNFPVVTEQIYYDTGTNYVKRHNAVGELPETWTNDATQNYIYSVYATYTESGGASIVPLVRHYQGMDMI